ncbi:phenolic glucoside malonyltransferase 1-like [Magnolia sinica]|uniref:phenolic glucoside malonyltransferase 1-like n=1 Tax=Magnolia sinica TaxID=86752 RepID=UPI0026586C8A|nr:phenolic glucoside malonyltransferase 1-like [Magnolia sinica]
MATPQAVKLLELCRVSPPPGSVPETTLPLTFFDVFWLLAPSVQRLLFYELSQPNTTTDFINTLLPKLKHSLSLSLSHFFPLAGNLTQSPITGDHEIHYIDGDSISLTIAESDANFHKLVSNHHRKRGTEFHPLLPQLQPPSLLALQVTIFPNTGISIGISLQHVVADGRSLAHFMKCWSSINGIGDEFLIAPSPFHERTILEDHDGLKRSILNQMAKAVLDHTSGAFEVLTLKPPTPTVRSTFVLSRANIELLRCRVLNRVEQSRKPFHCSTFVLTCAYVWTCLIKTRGEAITDENDHFVFAVDCQSRLEPPLPATYFGNCIGLCFAEAKRSDLYGEDGIVAASEAIGRAIQGLENGVLKGAMYFGDSRDEEGGIDVGLALSEQEMDCFASMFEEGVKGVDVVGLTK